MIGRGRYPEMAEREQQTLGVVLTLSGIQDCAVMAHHPDTENAVVSIRIGRALIYLHDPRAAATFAQAWRRHLYDAAKLPREHVRHRPVAPAGCIGAAVVLDARGTPPAIGRLVQPPGRASYLWIQLGRAVFGSHRRRWLPPRGRPLRLRRSREGHDLPARRRSSPRSDREGDHATWTCWTAAVTVPSGPGEDDMKAVVVPPTGAALTPAGDRAGCADGSPTSTCRATSSSATTSPALRPAASRSTTCGPRDGVG